MTAFTTWLIGSCWLRHFSPCAVTCSTTERLSSCDGFRTRKLLLLQRLHDLRCSCPGCADEAGERGRRARKPVGAAEKAQRHPFPIAQPMLIAFEIPSPRCLNQQLHGFSCQWHE